MPTTAPITVVSIPIPAGSETFRERGSIAKITQSITANEPRRKIINWFKMRKEGALSPGPSSSGGCCPRRCVHLWLRQGLAQPFRPEFAKDRLQGANSRRQRVAIIGDGARHEGGGFVVRQIEVWHGPDMGLPTALMNLIERHRAVRGSTGRRSKA
jgi:hypothetical protein